MTRAMSSATTFNRVVCLGVACAALACATDLPGTPPPADAFYFPIGLATSRDGRFVYVASSNFDLRFNAGWVSVVDLDAVLGGAAREEAVVGQLKIPSLGGEIAMSGDGAVMVLAHRGEGTLTFIDVAGVALSCGDPGATTGLGVAERRTDCDRPHLLELGPGGEDADFARRRFDDPYALLFIDGVPAAGQRTLAIGYQRSPRGAPGIISFFTLAASEGGGFALTEQRSRAFGDLRSISQLALHPDRGSGIFLAGVGRRNAGDVDDAALVSFDLSRPDDVGSVLPLGRIAGGLDGTSVTFAPDGSRAFVTVSYPFVVEGVTDGVVALDAAPRTDVVEVNGGTEAVVRPSYAASAVTALRGLPSAAAYVSRAAGDVLVVPGFEENVLYVLTVGPASLDLIARLDLAAEGPFRAIAIERNGREYVLVTTFLDHGLLVVDVTEADPVAWTQVHVRDPSLPRGDRIR